MRLAVLKERRGAETRVAATPDTVKRLIGLGLTVAVETGAGASAAMPDAEFTAAGAELAADPAATLAGAGIVFAVQAPLPEQRALIPRGALLVCTAGAFADPTLVPSLAEAGIDCAAMELLPRITRAQAMDVLSSQANLAGYRAVVEFRHRVPTRLPDDDDRRGHRAAGPRLRHRRRRRRLAGDRHRTPARCHRFGHRRSPGREGRNQVRSAPSSSAWKTRRPPPRPAPTHAK